MTVNNPHEIDPDLAVFLDGGHHDFNASEISYAQPARETKEIIDIGESLRTMFSTGQLTVGFIEPIGTYGQTKTSENFEIGDYHDEPASACLDVSTSRRHVLVEDKGGPTVISTIVRPQKPAIIAVGATIEAENGSFAVSLSTIGAGRDNLPGLNALRSGILLYDRARLELNRTMFVRKVLEQYTNHPRQ